MRPSAPRDNDLRKVSFAASCEIRRADAEGLLRVDSGGSTVAPRTAGIGASADDDLIAGILNRNKLTTGNGNRWTRERVTSLRSHHKIPVHRPAENGVEPWLNLTKAAAHLGVSAKTLRIAAESAEIEAPHPLPEGPWIFSRTTLHGSTTQRTRRTCSTGRQTPHRTTSTHQDLFTSMP